MHPELVRTATVRETPESVRKRKSERERVDGRKRMAMAGAPERGLAQWRAQAAQWKFFKFC